MLSRDPAFGDATAEKREAADSADLESCRMRSRGCAQAADVMQLISGVIRLETAGFRSVNYSVDIQ